MTEKNIRNFCILLTVILVLLFFVLFVLYRAAINGLLLQLVAALIVIGLAVAIGFERIAIGFRTVVEAFKIARSTHYEMTHEPRGRHSIKIISGPSIIYQDVPQLNAAPNNPAAPHPSVTDPRRSAGMALLEATLRDTARYGPNQPKIMTQNDAVLLNLKVIDPATGKLVIMNADLWEQACKYLCHHFDVFTQTKKGSKNGTYCFEGKNVADIMSESTALALASTSSPRPESTSGAAMTRWTNG